MGVLRKTWDPAEFHSWYEEQLPEIKKRAWADLSSYEAKRYREWKIFQNFYRAADLNVRPASVSLCEPPVPDVCCEIDGRDQYFELGEVVMEQIARDASSASRTDGVHGGPVSSRGPLLELFRKKCLKRYITNGTPLHLLLHFTVGHQYPIGLVSLTDLLEPGELARCQFASVFLYNDWDQEILESLIRPRLGD